MLTVKEESLENRVYREKKERRENLQRNQVFQERTASQGKRDWMVRTAKTVFKGHPGHKVHPDQGGTMARKELHNTATWKS